MQKRKNGIQGKAMLFAEGNHQSFIGGGGLQFKIKINTKSLSQRQAPSPIELSAKGRMNDKLHAPRFIKKSFRDNAILCRHRSQYLFAGHHVTNHLLRSRGIQPAMGSKPGLSPLPISSCPLIQHLAEMFPKMSHFVRQFGCP